MTFNGSSRSRSCRLDHFLTQHPNSPVVADSQVHFFYRGELEDLVVMGDMTMRFFSRMAPISMGESRLENLLSMTGSLFGRFRVDAL